MEIFLVRHAKSHYDWALYKTDSVRPLSTKGRERQNKVTRGMKLHNIKFDLVWVSPYKRAQETLEIIIDQYNYTGPIQIIEDLVPGGDEDVIYGLFQELFKKNPLMKLLVVGHNPLISSILEMLAQSFNVPEMKTSDVAHCELTATSSALLTYYHRKDLMNFSS